MWSKKIKSGCDQYNVWDSELSWQLTVNSFMLTFLYPIPPLHSSWTDSVFKLHLMFWTWEQGLAKNTTKPLWECFRPWPFHLTTQTPFGKAISFQWDAALSHRSHWCSKNSLYWQPDKPVCERKRCYRPWSMDYWSFCPLAKLWLTALLCLSRSLAFSHIMFL